MRECVCWKYLALPGIQAPDCPARSLVIIETTLSRLLLLKAESQMSVWRKGRSDRDKHGAMLTVRKLRHILVLIPDHSLSPPLLWNELQVSLFSVINAITLCYKLEVRIFESQYNHWGYFIDWIRPAALWLWYRLNFWQKWVPRISPGREGWRRPLRKAYIPYHLQAPIPNKFWEPQPSGALRVFPGL